ncbi:hypothetical protein [Stappia indica]|uniref:Secreted protein n=1 Tax=Stappia indica TaxID=538381 RepID=A0A857CB76_9HYPH|nr:hypothetical protein [Stappia indica]QGZ36313.1 hypothetical protein GH266_18575 [Stappia indica]
MTMFRNITLATATVLALTMAGATGTALANNNGSNNTGGTTAGQSQGGSSSGRVWSHKGPAEGVILCATRECMNSRSAATLTHVPNNPNGRPRRHRPAKSETCDTVRYVYPNGTVVVQSNCPRAVMGTISTHR